MAHEQHLKLVKTTVNLPADDVATLKMLAAARVTTITEILRRAIWLEKYLHAATQAGERILIQDRDKNVRELVIR